MFLGKLEGFFVLACSEASTLSSSLEGMLLPGRASPSCMAIPASCGDLVGYMARALLHTFLVPAGQSPLDCTSTSAGMVGCGGFSHLLFLSTTPGTK